MTDLLHLRWKIASSSGSTSSRRAVRAPLALHHLWLPKNGFDNCSRTLHCRSATSSGPGAATRQLALIVEVDGILFDMHMDGHRVAFNKAFADLGLDCANWSLPVYHDLLSRADGSGERMVATFFEMTGWPMVVQTNDKGAFAAKVLELKAKMLRRMLENDQVPLRRGIVGILDDALAAGANVAALAGTLSDPDDDAASSALRLLGHERSDLVKVFSAPTTRQRRSSDNEETGAGPINLAGRMASAANELRQREALNFVQALAGDGKDGVQVALAPELSGASTDAVSSQWLAALAALMGTPASNCVVLGSSTPVIRAAAGAGMVPVAVPRQMAARAIYPGARAKFDSLGPGSATWSKLKSLLPQQ